MRGQVFLTIGAMVFVFVSSAYSSSPPSEAKELHTLEDYLRDASLNNAELKARFQAWKSAIEQIPQAKSLPDPKFTYGYFIEEVETRVGPQKHKFEIMQTFPWFGVIEARRDEAAAKAKAAHKRYEAKKLELFEQVKYTFYEYGYLAKSIEITKQNFELIRYFEEIARSRYATAITPHPDIIRAQIEMAIIEDRLKSLKELRPAITARLNSLLNRPVSSKLPWPIIPEYKPVEIHFGQLHSMILQNNPQLQALDFEINAAGNKEKLAHKKSYPDMGIGLSYIDTAGARASGVSDSGKDPVIAMFSVTLPIWTDSYRAAERQASAQTQQKRHEKTEKENSLAARAQQLLYGFEDSNRKAALYRDVIIPKAKEMLTASESAYRSGTIDFLSLIDAQRVLLDYELRYERSVAENAQELARLEMLSGTELPIVIEEPAKQKER